MTPEITVEYGYTEPKPVTVTIGNVSFVKYGAFAVFYRWAEFCGILDQFLEEMKPYYWKEYQEAYQAQRAKEERRMKRMMKKAVSAATETAPSL